MIESARVPPLTRTERCDSTATLVVADSEMGLEEVPVLAVGLVVEEEGVRFLGGELLSSIQ